MREPIHSDNAPAAIGTYSQAIRANGTIYLSGQTPLLPATGQLVEGIEPQIHQVFSNLRAVAQAANASLDDAVKVTVYLTDLANFAKLNEIMPQYFNQPFPARTTIQVSALPRGAMVEVDVIIVPNR
jgi:reactive intermediate/imine deaminase